MTALMLFLGVLWHVWRWRRRGYRPRHTRVSTYGLPCATAVLPRAAVAGHPPWEPAPWAPPAGGWLPDALDRLTAQVTPAWLAGMFMDAALREQAWLAGVAA